MDVKLLRLTTGEDVVAEVTFSDDKVTTIKKPFVLIPMAQNPSQNAESKLYFSPFIPFAENDEFNIKVYWCNCACGEKDYIMSDEDNTTDNVIYGPWGGDPVKYDKNTTTWIKQKYDRELDKNNTQLQIKEKLGKIDSLTENVMVQMIHTLSERGYDITDEQFILDVGFLSEVIKGVLSRQDNMPK